MALQRLSLFAVTLIAGVLPSIDRIWPAHQITRALEGCAPGPVAVAGFREPSAYFVLGSDETLLEPDALRAALVEGRATYVASDVRDDKVRTLSRGQYRRLKPLACVEAFNTMRGCPLFFTIQTTGSPESCPAPGSFSLHRRLHDARPGRTPTPRLRLISDTRRARTSCYKPTDQTLAPRTRIHVQSRKPARNHRFPLV